MNFNDYFSDLRSIFGRKPFLLIIIISIISSVLFILPFCEKLHDDWWFVFYITHISIALFAISFWKFTYNQIFRPTKYLAILYGLSSFSFILISIIFGFHTDVLVKYDNIKNDKYYWFKANNIINFPLNSSNKKTETTKLHSSENYLEDIHNYFIIDNSKSIVYNKAIDKIVTEYCKNNLNKNFDIKAVNKDNSNCLITHYLSSKLINNNQNKNFYLLDGSFESYSTENIENNIINNNSKTNVEEILNLTSVLSNIVDDDKFYKRIYIVSNFNDSNPNSSRVSKIVENFNSLNKNVSKIISINLIKLSNPSEKESKIFSDLEGKEFKNKYLFNFIDTNINSIEDINLKLNYICAKISKDTLNLNFKYPNFDNNNRLKTKSKFLVNESTSKNYYILGKDLSYNTNHINCYCGKKQNSTPIYINDFELTQIPSIDKNDTVEINFDNYNQMDENLIKFELFSEDNNLITICNTTQLPYIPESNLFALLLVYTILSSSLSLMFFYLIYSLILSNTTQNKYLKNIYIIIASISLIPIFYFIILNITHYNFFPLFVLLVIILFTIIHYIDYLKEENIT